MNKIPLSLWKEVGRTKKSRALWQTIKVLGMDLGHEDPDWIIETHTYVEYETGQSYYYWFWDQGAAVTSRWPLLRCACWFYIKDGYQLALLRFFENSKPFFTISFLDLEAPIYGPEVYQKLFQWPKICVSCPGSSLGPHVVQEFSQGQFDFSSFSEQQMKRIIRTYQACSPLTFWFIEDMARFLHEQANLKSMAHLEP